jgi:hypothetical protein
MANNNKDRYCVTYVDANEKWSNVYAKTKKEAMDLYDMIGDEAEFKVLYDVVSGEQIEQT